MIRLLHVGFILSIVCAYIDGNEEVSGFKKVDALLEAKARISDLLNLVYSRYELHQLANLQHFLVSLNIPSNSWDILKFKLAEKMLIEGSKFTFVFSGTGVTAGYDNYLHQSYPMVIERRLSPIFKAINIDLLVRNIGQVHVDCRLSNYCFDGMGGRDADVVGWENSFDCGNAKDSHEFIARIAAHKKAVLFFSTSGAYPLDDCPVPSQDAIPWISETWTPQSASIRSVVFDRSAVAAFKRLQQDWHSAGSSAGRFTKALQNKYEGVGAHGFSVWAKSTQECDYSVGNATASPGTLYALSSASRDLVSHTSERILTEGASTGNNLKRKKREIPNRKGDHTEHSAAARHSKAKDTATYCESARLKGACHADGGPHWRVQEAAHYGNAQQRGRKWHPPIGMHLLRAEMLVYTYAQIFLDAIFMVEDALHNAVESTKTEKKPAKKGWGKQKKVSVAQDNYPVAARALLAEVRAKLAILQAPIPSEPLHCTTEECAAVPQCYTDYQPNYNPAHLLSNIVVGTHMGWYKEGVIMNDLGPEFGILDKKFYFKSEGSKNELHVQLSDVRAHGAVRLYARSKKEPLDQAVFYLDPHIHVTRNTTLYKNSGAYKPSAARYPILADQLTLSNSSSVDFVHIRGLPAGDHVLTIVTAPTNPYAISSLSHIVVF